MFWFLFLSRNYTKLTTGLQYQGGYRDMGARVFQKNKKIKNTRINALQNKFIPDNLQLKNG